jgi:flagellar FliL protein
MADEDPKPSSGMAAKLAIPLIAALVGGGAGVAGMMFMGGSKAESKSGEEEPAAAEGEAAAAEGEAKAEGAGEAKAEGAGEAKAEGAGGAKEGISGPVITSVGSFTVNLRGSGGGRVLRLEVSVESSAAHATILAGKSAQIRDSIITAVSDYTWSELEGTDGKVRLRDELLVRVNGITEPARVQRLYFTQFVVQ